MALSDKLYSLRKKSGLSQEQLAEQLNVSRQAISKWESGNSTPETEKLLLISEYFHVSIDYLLKEEETVVHLYSHISHDHIKTKIGFIICLLGIVGLLIWGLLSIINPSISNQIGMSSMIQIDGNGIFLMICICVTMIGAKLLLDSKK